MLRFESSFLHCGALSWFVPSLCYQGQQTASLSTSFSLRKPKLEQMSPPLRSAALWKPPAPCGNSQRAKWTKAEKSFWGDTLSMLRDWTTWQESCRLWTYQRSATRWETRVWWISFLCQLCVREVKPLNPVCFSSSHWSDIDINLQNVCFLLFTTNTVLFCS